jgi:hypothetical protein
MTVSGTQCIALILAAALMAACYARADIDLKRRALAQVFPDAVAPPPGGRLLLKGSDLVDWLRRI